MTLIEDIQNAAIDGTTDVATLLLKCKVLAVRLGSQDLEDWLSWESSGYPTGVGVPHYRIWRMRVMGHFGDTASRELHPDPLLIPYPMIPRAAREDYRHYKCRLSVSGIIDAIKGAKDDVVQIDTGNLAYRIETSVFEGMRCQQCWGEYHTGHLTELLNVVRNGVLDFVNAVWKEDPSAGEVAHATTIEPAQVNQFFQNTVVQGNAVIAGMMENCDITNVEAGNIDSLERALSELGVSSEDFDALRPSLESEQPGSDGKLGPKVRGWIGTMASKALAGGLKIAGEQAVPLLVSAITRFCGLS